MSVTYLLGPQRFLTTAGAVVRDLGNEGPVATITSGWEDREGDDGELDEVLDGRGRNLRLYTRAEDVLDRDQEVARRVFALRDAMDELSGLYTARLASGLDAVRALRSRSGRTDLVEAAVDDAVESVRAVDRWYLERLRLLKLELVSSGVLQRSEVVAQHRREVGEVLDGCSALAVAGGHVGFLLWTLQLFEVEAPPHLPVVAWSAGAMAMCDRVVLFHDTMASGATDTELWDRGLRRIPGVIAFPHARRRLQLDKPERVGVLARRFAGYSCVLLDDGAKVQLGPDNELPSGARVLGEDGFVHTVGQHQGART